MAALGTRSSCIGRLGMCVQSGFWGHVWTLLIRCELCGNAARYKQASCKFWPCKTESNMHSARFKCTYGRKFEKVQ